MNGEKKGGKEFTNLSSRPDEQRRVLRLSPSAALDAGSGNQGGVAGPGHVLCALGESWRRNPHQ